MLTPRELEILAFEKIVWKLRGSKESQIRELFSVTPYVYYLWLNRVIEKPEAEQLEPELVRRLRRLRDDMIARKRVGRG